MKINDNGIYREMTPEEIAEITPSPEQAREMELRELHEYLNSTDYIWASIQEGGRTEEYYADVIAKRKQARLRIRELEG